MKGFFASVGRGILYFLTPFGWIIGMVVGGAIALIVFLCYAIYSIFLFFTGRNMFKELPEDIEANKLKELDEKNQQAAFQASQAPINPQPQGYYAAPQASGYVQPQPQPVYPQQQIYPQQPQQQMNVPPIGVNPSLSREEPIINAQPQPRMDLPKREPLPQQPRKKVIKTEEIEEYIPEGDSLLDDEIEGDGHGY